MAVEEAWSRNHGIGLLALEESVTVEGVAWGIGLVIPMLIMGNMCI